MQRTLIALALAIACCMRAGVALTPLTRIQPTLVELAAFSSTVLGILARLKLDKPVIHLVGASDVEAAVDWSDVCATGATLVLVGDKAVQRRRTDDDCVVTVRALYRKQSVIDALQPPSRVGARAASADVFILLNADLYMCVWRRALAEMLHAGKPIVLTAYCAYEGSEMQRLLQSPSVEFGDARIAHCDAEVARLWPSFAAPYNAAAVGRVPPVRTLWSFEANPNAHAAPRDCTHQHGVRNAHWMAFQGDSGVVAAADADEL